MYRNNIWKLDEVLDFIHEFIFEIFTRKWSGHKCNHKFCNYTITFDGNWKISRLKCAYDLIYYQSDFGKIQIGCPHTPDRKSYYCGKPEHRNYNLVFNYGFDKTGQPRLLTLLPKHIKRTRLCKPFILINHLMSFLLINH